MARRPHGMHQEREPEAAVRNPRYANGNLRRKQREHWKRLGLPCALCHRPIDYSLGMVDDPVTGRRRPHPMSFVIDEKKPTARWREFGYASAKDAALDWDNQQPAHWICNARKGDGTRQANRTLPLPQPWEL